MHADPTRTSARDGARPSWSPIMPGMAQPPPPDDPAGAALLTVLARRLRGMSAILAARAEAVGGEPDPHGLRRRAELQEAIGRLDRYCDSLLALAGVPFGRPEPEPRDLLDLLAAAASTVERHTQIELGTVDGGVAVSGWVAGHAQHAVAELLDNGTFFSPPGSPVTLDAWLVDGGLLVRVVDRGVGIGAVRLEELNALLSKPPGLHPDLLRASGLPVVAVLADWYGWTVRLDSRPGRGTVAELLLPRAVLVEPPAGGAPAAGCVPPAAAGSVPPAVPRGSRPGTEMIRRRPPVPVQRAGSTERALPTERGLPADRGMLAPGAALPRRQRAAAAVVPAVLVPAPPPRDPVATAAALAAYQRARPPVPPEPVDDPPPSRTAYGSAAPSRADRTQGTTDGDAGGR